MFLVQYIGVVVLLYGLYYVGKYIYRRIFGTRLVTCDGKSNVVSVRSSKSKQTASSVANSQGINSLLDCFGARHVNAIVDQFHNLTEVSNALRLAGLEYTDLIIGIDYTVSNCEQGERTFEGFNLHDFRFDMPNPYQQVIESIGRTLEPLNASGIFPVFGFGDEKTKDRNVFPLREQGYCIGVDDIMEAYREVTPQLTFSGPTCFAPIIRQACKIVQATRRYHVLLIVADGQVSKEKATRDAVIEAANLPLTIVIVGVGDGPWAPMYNFLRSLPQRSFDNCYFVDFHQVITYGKIASTTFALHALSTVPDHFKIAKELQMI